MQGRHDPWEAEMHTIDVAILLFLNRFANASPVFDHLILAVSNNSLLKGGTLVALLWWSWAQVESRERRAAAAWAFAGVFLAIAAARGMQNFLPVRPRPLRDLADASAGFVPPAGVILDGLERWSSFPSDHAALAFGVSTAIFLIHRRAGLFAYAWSLAVVCLPRVYLGLHYPSDILGGAAVGVAVTAAVAHLPVLGRTRLAGSEMMRHYRGLVYAVLFLMTYQMATMFDDVRNLGSAALSLWHVR